MRTTAVHSRSRLSPCDTNALASSSASFSMAALSSTRSCGGGVVVTTSPEPLFEAASHRLDASTTVEFAKLGGDTESEALLLDSVGLVEVGVVVVVVVVVLVVIGAWLMLVHLLLRHLSRRSQLPLNLQPWSFPLLLLLKTLKR